MRLPTRTEIDDTSSTMSAAGGGGGGPYGTSRCREHRAELSREQGGGGKDDGRCLIVCAAAAATATAAVRGVCVGEIVVMDAGVGRRDGGGVFSRCLLGVMRVVIRKNVCHLSLLLLLLTTIAARLIIGVDVTTNTNVSVERRVAGR